MVPSIHSTCSRLLPGLALALGLLASPFGALAQESPEKPSPEAIEQAKKHYQNALDHHGHKEYPAAAREYEKAFLLFPNPEFVFNAAQVYRLDGNVRVAIEKYERYLQLDSDGRGAADARAHLASLKVELAALEKREQETRDAEARRLEDQRRTAEENDRREEEERAADLEFQRNIPPPNTGNRNFRIAGLASMGVGVVCLGVGGKFALDAKGLEQDVTGNTVWSQRDFDDGQDAERNAFLFFGVGAAALVGGGVLYWMGRGDGSRASSESSLALVPSTDARSASLLLQGDF